MIRLFVIAVVGGTIFRIRRVYELPYFYAFLACVVCGIALSIAEDWITREKAK